MISVTELKFTDSALEAQALELAQRLHLTINQQSTNCLVLSADHLALKLGPLKPLYAEFSAKAYVHRKAEGKKQGLVRACKPHRGLKILDATAGWGKDAAILASFGAELTLVERNPIMAALLHDALNRRSDLDKESMHLSLVHADALQYINALTNDHYPDIIYIDPMHPQRQKSALVKKEMQVLQQLIGTDIDAQELITLARQRVRDKVVVKWPQKMPPLLPYDGSIEGTTVRFDWYRT